MSAALLVISPDLGVVGTRLGMSSVLAGLGFLVGPPIAGAIQGSGSGGGFVGQGVFAAVVYAAAFGVLWVARVVFDRSLKGERGGGGQRLEGGVELKDVEEGGNMSSSSSSSRVTLGEEEVVVVVVDGQSRK